MKRSLLAAMCILATSARARAGNDDAILIGSDAMMTGGAVTAIVSDGAAAWYNPAGLAQVQRGTLNINASTYGVSRTVADGAFTLSDGSQTSIKVVDWQLVPSALSYARELTKGVVGAAGVFIPTTSDGDLRSTLTGADGRRWLAAVDQVRNEYAYVAAIGVRTSASFRWGIALHGVYISSELMSQVASGNPGQNDAPFYSGSQHRTTSDYGARIGVGFQWVLRPGLELGVSVQTPTLTGLRSIRDDVVETRVPSDARFAITHEDRMRGVWELSTPLQHRLGLAWTVARYRFLLDGTFSSALASSERSFERRTSGNARIAGTYAVTDNISAGAGVFSDLNGYRHQQNQNFVGTSAGVRFSKDLTLATGTPLSFVTTLGLRYALGWGHITRTVLDADPTLPAEPISEKARIRVHELAFNLGGGVTY